MNDSQRAIVVFAVIALLASLGAGWATLTYVVP